MKISKQETRARLAKLEKEPSFMTFALSPKGFLMISKKHSADVGNFTLYRNGKWLRRQGFQVAGSMDIPEQGFFLCATCRGKILLEVDAETMDFGSRKKALAEDTHFLLQFCCDGRVMLLIADAAFAPEPFFITLTDTECNMLFTERFMERTVRLYDPDSASKLIAHHEEDENDEQKGINER